MNYKKINEKTFQSLRTWGLATSAMVLLAAWAFFESSIWFIAPDFLLFILAVLQPKKYKKFLLVSIIFSLIGTSFYFAFASMNPELSSNVLENTPLVNENMLRKVDSIYLFHGVYGPLRQTTTSIPSKVWTYQAVQHKFNPALYILFIFPSRFLRMAIFAILGFFIGKKYEKLVRHHFIPLLALYSISFISSIIYLGD